MKLKIVEAEPIPLQLAPMIDILFLLLAFFVVSWQFSKAETELNVSVPTAQEGNESQRTMGEIIINVLANGTIKVESSELSLSALGEKLLPIAKQFKNQPVRIRGDGNVPYQKIVEVIDVCQKSGIWNVSFATQRPEPK